MVYDHTTVMAIACVHLWIVFCEYQSMLRLFWLLHGWRFATIWKSGIKPVCGNNQRVYYYLLNRFLTNIIMCLYLFTNLLSCSWLGYVMMTLFPSERRPVVVRLLPVLRMCRKVMSVWPLRAALLCFCFLSV